MTRRVVAIAALLCAAGPAHAQERPPITDLLRPYVSVDHAVIALTNVRLIDGTGAPARDGQTIVINGSRIQAVGPARVVSIPTGAHVIDVAGHTVIPGLVQLHEHTWLGGLDVSRAMPWSAALYLANGVTTAMTAGSMLPYDELSLKQAIDTGRMPGPRLHIAGPYLHGGAPWPRSSRIINSEAEARRVVNYWADEGATWFKILNGPADVVRWTVAAARDRGAHVTIHPCSVTFAEAAALGVRAIQHGFITASEYVPGRTAGQCPRDNQVAQADVDVASDVVQASIRALAATGVGVVSTLSVYETFSPAFQPDPRALAALPADVRAEMEARFATTVAGEGSVPERLLGKMMQWERDFVAAGGLLASGSDPWGSGLVPGFGNLRNYELLVEAGFAPEMAVRIMTLNGATVLGEESEYGSIEAGKVADLVVVRGDPVSHAGSIYDVVTVFRGGAGYGAAALMASDR